MDLIIIGMYALGAIPILMIWKLILFDMGYKHIKSVVGLVKEKYETNRLQDIKVDGELAKKYYSELGVIPIFVLALTFFYVFNFGAAMEYSFSGLGVTGILELLYILVVMLSMLTTIWYIVKHSSKNNNRIVTNIGERIEKETEQEGVVLD